MDPAGPRVATDPAGSGAAPPREVGGPRRPPSARSVLALGGFGCADAVLVTVRAGIGQERRGVQRRRSGGGERVAARGRWTGR
jgi:hypothetical protein